MDSNEKETRFSPVQPRRKPRLGIRQLFLYLGLLSTAVTLSLLLPTPWSFLTTFNTSKVAFVADPADEWQDNVWPLRPQTPWDISTDFPHPRKLSYAVQEGTWLRLDVNPVSGDIVFDMVGDLYCLPGSEALSFGAELQDTSRRIRAVPVTAGVPWDADPHFSSTGDRLVFKSDAELGLENIWVVEWKGCEAMDVRSVVGTNEDMRKALDEKELEEQLLRDGIVEDAIRRRNRLLREGRLHAQRVTNETYRWVSDARFHPSSSKVIATKWYTSGRSLGAGEAWEYSVPSVDDLRASTVSKIRAGSGKRVIGRNLPAGWSSEDYGEVQIGPEQFIWHGDNAIIFAKNVADDPSQFEYSKDVHRGIYAIYEKNLSTGITTQLVSSTPGGASRPEISRDGRTLAFVRRVRDKEALVLKDLTTGSIHNVWHGLTYDASAISAPMGTYPSFAFTPDDNAVIIWAAGHIYSVPLSTNSRGEKVASASKEPYPIRFRAQIEKDLAETRRNDFDIVDLETRKTQRARAFKELRVDSLGRRAIFNAGGATYWQQLSNATTFKVPVLDESAAYYSPSFIHMRNDLIVHARWSDSSFTTFELANLRTGRAYEVTGLPLGRYFNPVLCDCFGNRRKIAFLKSGGTYLTGDTLATANPGLYIADIVLPPSDSTTREIRLENVKYVNSEIDTRDRVDIRFVFMDKTILVQQSQRAFTIDLSAFRDKFGKPPHTTLASGEMSMEMAVSTFSPRRNAFRAENIAFVDFHHVYLVSGDRVREGEAVWSRPDNATKGLARLSLDGGHDVTWARDGKTVFWFLGPYLHSLEISKLKACANAISNDRSTFGISCVKSLTKYQEVIVEHSTDIARLKEDAIAAAQVNADQPNAESYKPSAGTENKFKRLTYSSPSQSTNSKHAEVIIFYNATVLTMRHGTEALDIVRDGAVVIEGGVFLGAPRVGREGYEGLLAEYNGKEAGGNGLTTIDLEGGYIIPGFVDVHAHWEGDERYPARSWEMETFLAYGVTTLHNPSSDTVDGFSERTRLERGLMVGPRIFTVGTIIYGAGAAAYHEDVVDMNEAYSALIRLRVEGGPASISYKNYNQPSRASRQRLLTVAKNISMLCVPEGGMNWDWDLTYILDGMTSVEHNLPIPILYDDVLNLYALSGTAATPTHLVNYGGGWGEQIVWATHDVPNDPKLRRFVRHDLLETLSESIVRPKNSFALYNTSTSVAKMVRKGLLANIGAHGEPPIGLNYHAEMGFAAAGGLTNYEVLRAATRDGAKTLGLFNSLGSIESGKLADFLIYPPSVDLLEGQITEKTLQLQYVARGGRVYDAGTMVEVWPVSGRKSVMPSFNAE